MVPFALCLFSSICNVALIYHIAPDYYKTGILDKAAADKHYVQVYMATYCRMSPYGFGMLAAYRHLEETKRSKAQKSYEDVAYIISWKCFGLEFLSFTALFYVIFCGMIPDFMDKSLSNPHKFFNLSMGR